MADNRDKFVVYLLGFTQFGHTNWYPWKKFQEVFEHLGYECRWVEKEDVKQHPGKRRVFISWYDPDTIELINDGIYQDGDIILNKLVCFGKYDSGIEWGTTPEERAEFFRTWRFTQHQIFEQAHDAGVNVYAFGAKTRPEGHLEKERIFNKLKDRIFEVPWGSSLCSYDEVQNCKPVMDGFTHDVGFVGSIWGKAGRGNIDSAQQYMFPLLEKYTSDLGGPATKRGHVDDPTHKQILVNAKICPIINAPSWREEKGLMDRFWSIFTLGRFGVADSLGAYDFYNEDEVVVATSAEEYIELSEYYIKNVDKQLPFIEKIQKRIREEYNWYNTWQHILENIE